MHYASMDLSKRYRLIVRQEIDLDLEQLEYALESTAVFIPGEERSGFREKVLSRVTNLGECEFELDGIRSKIKILPLT
jgi:hypothetical protein